MRVSVGAAELSLPDVKEVNCSVSRFANAEIAGGGLQERKKSTHKRYHLSLLFVSLISVASDL